VDEESGMTGAINLKPDFFTGRTLLNLDSEDEGILYIGCAGGMDTIGTMTYEPVPVMAGTLALEISLTGLHGGHSGDEIHKGYGNSVKIMNRILYNLADLYDISVSNFNGGNLRNAIPRESFSTIIIDKSIRAEIIKWIDNFSNSLTNEFGALENDIRLSVQEVDLPSFHMDKNSQKRFLSAISCCPHGALAWSKEMDDLVETSTNLASAKFTDNNTIRIITTQRSSVESSRNDAAAMVESCLELAGAEVVHSEGYPGWKPDLKSEILGLTRESDRKLFAKEPVIRAIHAGLECGLVYEKIKDIDMISFGPTIRGAHTPEEMIEIKSTKLFWDLLVNVVSNMPVSS
jgi:dipeptidase D